MEKRNKAGGGAGSAPSWAGAFLRSNETESAPG